MTMPGRTITEEERATMEAARVYFNRMVCLIHRAKMHRRHGIGAAVPLKKALALHDDMQAHRAACNRLQPGLGCRDEWNTLQIVLATDLLSVWSVLLSEINGATTYPTPKLKTRRMYDLAPDGRGWAWQRLNEDRA